MHFGEIEIPDWRIDFMCRNLSILFQKDWEDPEKRAQILAGAERVREELDRREQARKEKSNESSS